MFKNKYGADYSVCSQRVRVAVEDRVSALEKKVKQLEDAVGLATYKFPHAVPDEKTHGRIQAWDGVKTPVGSDWESVPINEVVAYLCKHLGIKLEEPKPASLYCDEKK